MRRRHFLRAAVLAGALASGEANINNHFVAPAVLRVEAGDPIVFLGGAPGYSTLRSWATLSPRGLTCSLVPSPEARHAVPPVRA